MRTTEDRVDARGRLWRSPQTRRKLIETYEASGLSKSAFCREHALHLATFCHWLKRRKALTPVFAEVQVSASALGPRAWCAAAPLEIELRSGVRLQVHDLARVPGLATLVRELAACSGGA